MKKFSVWNQPVYTFLVENYAEIPFTVRWAGSELGTNEQAKKVAKLIWFYIVNPDYQKSFDSVAQVLPDGGADALAAFISESEMGCEIKDLKGWLLDGNGERIAMARAGDRRQANIRLEDLGQLVKEARS